MRKKAYVLFNDTETNMQTQHTAAGPFKHEDKPGDNEYG